MHILFLSDNFPPETNAPASRTFEHARVWVAAGHRVTVITCVPNFPDGKPFAGYRNRAWQKETIEGVEVIRVWSYIASNTGFALRTLDFLSYMVTSFIASLFVRGADIVVGTSPQFFTACSAWAAAAVKRRPFVFELRDLWPESIRAVEAMKPSPILDWLERLELFLYRRAALIVSVTRSFRRNLIERGIDRSKIAVVTNGVDLGRFAPAAKDPALVAELGLEAKFVAGYIGTHGMAHALETLLEAAAIVRTDPSLDDVRLVLLGSGAQRDRLRARAAEMGLDNVLFLDSVPKHEVARYWALMDASIVHLRRSDLFKTVIPSKIFESMGMGIPILLGVEGESAEIVETHGAGLTFEPESAGQLVERIRKLRQDGSLRAALAQAGQSAARSYDRGTLAAAMLTLLEETASQAKSARRPRP